MELDQLNFYVVELRSRADRRENIARELDYHKLLSQTIFIDASQPCDPEIHQLSGGFTLDIDRGNGATVRMELACLASHLRVLHMIATKKVPGVVLEGDALFHKDFRSIMEQIMKQITPVHELIYLGCYGASPYKESPQIIARNGMVWGTMGYWVTPSRAEKMIKVFGRPMKTRTIYTSELISHPSLGPSHQVEPLLVIEDPCGFSSLRSGEHEERSYKYFATLGLENYGAETRKTNPPFIVLLHCYLGSSENEERKQLLEKLKPYLSQRTFRNIAVKRGLTFE